MKIQLLSSIIRSPFLLLLLLGGYINAQTVPYDLVKFQDYLKECKLQFPQSNTAATQSDIINGYSSSSFYVVDNDKIAFNQSGAVKRSELRFVENWFVGQEDQTLHSNIKIEKQTCEQLTILQIHDDANEGVGDGPNKPLLRVYNHTTKSPANHLWAVVKTDASGTNDKHFDLGATPTGYFDCDISISGNNLIVSLNGEEKVNYDISYWDFPSYWKNGVYLQDEGEATTYFNELTLTYGTVSNIDVTGVDVSPSNASFEVGETNQLTATVSPSDASNKNVAWSSSKTSVATVNSNGIVVGVSEGSATITVTTEDGSYTASTVVLVTGEINTGRVPYDLVKFQDYLKECKLQFPQSNTAATQSDIINGYSSSSFYVVDNDKIAFNQSGAVKRSELRFVENWFVGQEDQTLHSNIKIEKQTCEQLTILQIHDDANEGVGDGPNKPLLRVYNHTTKSPANHLWAVVKTDASGTNDKHFDLGATPAEYFDCDISIAGNNLIISLDGEEKVNYDISYWDFPSYWKNGVYLQDEGEATTYFNELTLTYGTVSEVDVTGVEVPPNTPSIIEGGINQLTAVVSPSNASNKNVTWSSSNTSVATVSSSGVVTGVSQGSATITVTTEDGSYTASTIVTVQELVTGLINIALNKGVTASMTPEDINPVEALVDGNPNTRVSAQGYPQVLTIDLGANYDISYSELVFHENRAYQYTISIATVENGPFTEVVDQSSNATPGTVDSPLSDYFTETGRYIQLTITGADVYAGEWVSVSEFSVFGKEAVVTSNSDRYVDSKLFLYPMPAGDILNYKLKNIEGAENIEIYDLTGGLVLSQKLVKQNGSINVSQLNTGMYIVKIVGQISSIRRFSKN